MSAPSALCDPLSDALVAGAPLTAAQRAHLAQCAGCRALVAASLLLRGAESFLVPALPNALAALPTPPVSPYSAWRRAPPALLALVLPLLVGVAMRPNHVWDTQRTVLAALWLGVGLLGLVLTLRRTRVGLGVGARGVALGVAAAVVAFAAGAFAWSQPGTPDADAWSHTQTCGSVSVALSALGLGAWVVAARRTAVVHAGLLGALCGAAGAMGAVLALHAVCEVRDLWHLWGSHGVGLVLAMMVGALAGRRVLAP